MEVQFGFFAANKNENKLCFIFLHNWKSVGAKVHRLLIISVFLFLWLKKRILIFFFVFRFSFSSGILKTDYGSFLVFVFDLRHWNWQSLFKREYLGNSDGGVRKCLRSRSFSLKSRKYVTTIVAQVSIFCTQECLKASRFIGYSFSFSKGFLSTSPQKLFPLTPYFFLLRNLQIRLCQLVTIFCMFCLSCAYTTWDR